MDINEAYRVFAKNCGIKIGDKVKVLRIANEFKMGWRFDWVDNMDKTIGMKYFVQYINEEGDFYLNCGENTTYLFPFFVLEKIKEEKTYKSICKELKPFDRILVRAGDDSTWQIDFFERIKDNFFVGIISEWQQCIPYEGYEDYLGTTKNPMERE